MQVWCSYCLRFLGEKPPIEDPEVSHGICPACESRLMQDDLPTDRLHALRALQQDMWEAGGRGDMRLVPELLQRGRALGVRPGDLLVGIAAPLLVYIGKKWQTCEFTVAEEHRYTRFFLAAASSLKLAFPDLSDHMEQEAPDLLLAAVEGNAHETGLAMLELVLAQEGVNSHVVPGALPAHEVAGMALRLQPRMVGLSISLADQLPALQQALTALARVGWAAEHLLVGGHAVKAEAVTTADLPEGVCLIPDSQSLLQSLGKA